MHTAFILRSGNYAAAKKRLLPLGTHQVRNKNKKTNKYKKKYNK